MEKKIGLLDVSQRELFGYGLSFCNSEELQEIENQLVQSLHRIRERKVRILMDHIKHLKEKERLILEEKARISGKCGAKDQQQLPGDQEKDIVTLTNRRSPCSQGSDIDHAETELFIGQPEMRCL